MTKARLPSCVGKIEKKIENTDKKITKVNIFYLSCSIHKYTCIKYFT